MKFKEVIDEYILVPNQKFNNVDLSSGNKVGNINTSVGILEVWKYEVGDEVIYGAVLDAIGPTKPISFIGFVKGNNSLMAKNAWTETKFQMKGISSSLMMFVAKVDNDFILSDVALSVSGVKLWDSLINSGRFDVKILYIPTMESFDLDKADGKTKTSDGEILIDPKYDNNDNNMYNNNTGKGQRFFYMIKVKDNFVVETQGQIFNFSMIKENHLHKLIQPINYFYEDEKKLYD